MFINTLNAEALSTQLQEKLQEVEDRIMACSRRRQERLEGISGQQRKRNNKKAQQMSELRLSLETQRMERWGKLQKRLEAVKLRREARFEEIGRRNREGPGNESKLDSGSEALRSSFESVQDELEGGFDKGRGSADPIELTSHTPTRTGTKLNTKSDTDYQPSSSSTSSSETVANANANAKIQRKTATSVKGSGDINKPELVGFICADSDKELELEFESSEELEKENENHRNCKKKRKKRPRKKKTGTSDFFSFR